ncbi:hypothetical protein IWQ56_003437 [Coemansia nantahalensis]|uniref:Uncharacterized protein n=2 Tax=Coemansia TaxID=4863 RepID=A0ACC1KW25_9FUNG|nr:hypothetical protein IWQ56_003437 [Coemansia nantahalensis]KAJ2767381.1 hypothetical protein IWQ57_003970 [Coemansia nantahalensis]KAJ2796099.1 hypothetical protein H4R21_004848 [Coemansia helicoidea]
MVAVRQRAGLALFGGCVAAAGDTIAQGLEGWAAGRDRRRHDGVRTLRFFVYGAAFAQASFAWHRFLSARFPLQAAAGAEAAGRPLLRKAAVVLKRIAVDQIVFAPFACASYIVGMGALEGRGPRELLARVRAQLPQVLLAGYCLWPAAQLVNFSIVPLAYRVHFGSAVGMFWNTYLSWTSAQLEQQARLHSPPGAAAMAQTQHA